MKGIIKRKNKTAPKLTLERGLWNERDDIYVDIRKGSSAMRVPEHSVDQHIHLSLTPVLTNYKKLMVMCSVSQ
ncbi:hypothetical protein PoB_006178900 [Plakobranchus ocellatus]|uniref:Uncharacterized protein n=1 Tax=Plakobranchus ocellatus TaxID=259542 RepID=A0AAV4CTP6_9GAST|nr:hypothetical protein PoB_006178900 [Plakobranchus ocellatus]